MADAASDYPSRPRFFANRFVRVLAKACVANTLGSDGCWLLTVVALTEDAKGYRSPVTFFNEQLMPLVGAKNVKALDRIRAKALASGWLRYAAGGKGKAGSYWVEIPPEHRNWDDAPTDESNDGGDYSGSKSTKEAGENREQSGERTGKEVGKEPGTKRGENREGSGQHSSYTKDNLSLAQDPLTPAAAEGGSDPAPEACPAVGPKPAEVVAHWNSFPGLTPAIPSDPHRDPKIRTWATQNPLWVAHWRDVIAFMGRTPLYAGGGREQWRANLGWLFKDDHFSTALERMLAAAADTTTSPHHDKPRTGAGAPGGGHRVDAPAGKYARPDADGLQTRRKQVPPEAGAAEPRPGEGGDPPGLAAGAA